MIENVRLIAPWDGREFFLWGTADEELPYRLCRGVEFSRDYVLNHRMEERMPLRRGVPVEGLIIATSLAPLPSEYNHGARLSLVLEFLDQFGTDYPLQTEVRVNRRIVEMERMACPRKPSSLFAQTEAAVGKTLRKSRGVTDPVVPGLQYDHLPKTPPSKRGLQTI